MSWGNYYQSSNQQDKFSINKNQILPFNEKEKIYTNTRPVNSFWNKDLKDLVNNEFIRSPQWVIANEKMVRKL